MSEPQKICLPNVFSDSEPDRPARSTEHPAVVLAEKIEERLFTKNKLWRIKAIYTVDELWDLFRNLLVNHFGNSEEARLKAWTYNLKCKGRVQVLNALYDLLEERYPPVKFERRTAKPKREE
ncbi:MULTISPECIES: hypothetical protein [Aeromonas]|uniref:Uncharacterized protein n=1 Tax=Aeromonas caviae TaxID=648 RepID=A0AA42VBH6_AERCA|nr:hypothetical protein [Aeromonas caviae]MDH1897727.1 hypothetical protein [Aeromonas caviae]